MNNFDVRDYIEDNNTNIKTNEKDEYKHFIQELPLYDVVAAEKRKDILEDSLESLREKINNVGSSDIPEDLIDLYDNLEQFFIYLIKIEGRISKEGR